MRSASIPIINHFDFTRKEGSLWIIWELAIRRNQFWSGYSSTSATVKIAAVALIVGLILGIILGVLSDPLRIGHVRVVLRLYLEFFRIVPTVVLLFLFYYILPRQLNFNLPMINWPPWYLPLGGC